MTPAEASRPVANNLFTSQCHSQVLHCRQCSHTPPDAPPKHAHQQCYHTETFPGPPGGFLCCHLHSLAQLERLKRSPMLS